MLRPRRLNSLLLALIASAILFSRNAAPQLAITEMMTSYLSPSDFFELTNFGTNNLNLADYLFTDADHGRERLPLIRTGEAVMLAPLESILFVRTNRSSNSLQTNGLSIEQFRRYWAGCLDPKAQTVILRVPGFSSYGD